MFCNFQKKDSRSGPWSRAAGGLFAWSCVAGFPGLGQASETVSGKCTKQYMEKCVKRAHEKVRGKGASKAAWIFA